MRELLIILRREFLERVRTRSFILSTALTPVFFVLVFLGPALAARMGGGDDKQLAIVDESGGAIGVEVAAAISGTSGSDRYLATVIDRPLSAVQDSLVQAVVAEELDGFVHIPAGVVESGSVQFRALSVTDMGLERRISQAVTGAVQGRRLASAGIDPGRLAGIMAPVRVQSARLTSGGEAGESGEAGMIFSFVVGFALYMLILLYGAQVLQSVQEEKTNRIAEILVSSVKASHLMLGKVLGVAFAALLQIAIWVVVGIALSGPLVRLMTGSDSTPGLFTELAGRLDAGTGAIVLGYLLLGFFLYASLFAAAGAAAASSEDAQRFTFPLITPLIIPMMMTSAIVSDPRGTMAVVLGWIPLTMPLAMPMRIGAGGTSTVEVIASLIVLAGSVLALGWVAGKIYRIGILSTGKRPTFGELIRWLRMA